MRLNFRLELLSNTHVGSGFGKGKLLDDLMVQMKHPACEVELPAIPGPTLKGRVKEQFGHLVTGQGLDAGAIERIFGSSRNASPLAFDHAYLEPSLARDLALAKRVGAAQHLRASVSLHRKRRVARHGHLSTIDVAERGLEFDVQIQGSLPGESVEDDLASLAAAASMVTHVGSHKSGGLGRCWIRLDSCEPPITEWLEWSRLKESR